MAKKDGIFERIAAFIVDKRAFFFLFYVVAIIFSFFSMGWVEVEDDITKYLNEDTETRQGIDAMNENFIMLGSAKIMVSNVTYETAETLAETLRATEGVSMLSFDDTADHYRDAYALFDLTFDGAATEETTLEAMETIRENLAPYDHYIDTTIGSDMNAMLQKEMTTILIVAVIIILIVLTLTSRSYMEVPVLLITFGVAALLNMGSNFMLGRISFISNSVAVVLQLALAIDYAIILCHRFSDECETRSARNASVAALAKAIPEISASSLTTISGLAALGFMQFGIGLDMALVLIKAIIFSLLSVFTLMPGLLVLFGPLLEKTKHKKLLPNITPLGKFAVKTRRVLPPIFGVVLIAGFILSNQSPYAFGFNDIETAKMTEQQQSYLKIKDTFGTSNMVAILVPRGDYEAESKILAELDARPEVKSTMGLANTEIMDGYMLTDALTPRELSELVDLDYEVAQVLYSAYAMEQNQYGEILNGLDEYRVPLFDMFIYLKDQLDTNNISLEGDEQAMMTDMLDQLATAQSQLQSDQYSRMVMHLHLPEESEETFAFLNETRTIIGQYYEDDYYLVGNSTNARDLSDAFQQDNLLISILSALFVIIVLLFTFQSVGLPILLIVVIQGSIWINFSFPTLTDTPLYFLGYLIVSAIQMGANIDYAIVISSHYKEYKAEMPHKKAIVRALNASFPTIFTSGTIMSAAGLLIGNLSTQPVISIMGNCIGRGTVISMILVLCVLPSILVLGDSIIERTSFKMKRIERKTKEVSGTMRVQGRLKGYISGMVDGEFKGTIRGDLNATLSTDTVITQEGGEEHE